MLVFDEQSHPIILEDIYTPILTDYIWVLDLEAMDFTLAPLLVLEEIMCPSIQVRIEGFDFFLPTTWNMLIVDPETSQLDVIKIKNLAGKQHTALIYGPNMPRPTVGNVSVVDYSPNHQNIGPSLNKNQMVCHPIGPDRWINVAPSDTYNKYLKDSVIGDII